jgi:serine/threonine-protein kinase
LDFGIAKLKAGSVTNLTQQGVIVGTPYYMSPEQCVGDELDARSDIYSLGIIIYEVLTGRVPFRASTPMGVALKHANEAPVPPRELRSDLPYPIENVVLRALRKHREDRPSSAMELAQEFESALYQAGVELKLLGTKTPPDTFTLGGHTDTYRGTAVMQPPDRSISPDRSVSPDSSVSPEQSVSADRGMPVGASAAVAQPVETLELEPPERLPIPDLFQQVTKGPLSILNRMWEEPRSRKILIAALGVVLIVGLVVVAVLFTRSNPSPGVDTNSNKTTTPTPAPVLIPPPPPGMVTVAAGKFTRGNPSGDILEKPVKEEVVGAFYMDQNEVTNKEYYKFVSETTYYKWPDDWSDNWKMGNFGPDDDQKPVTGITWNDAQNYAKWSRKRLPTEVEWEYAARGRNGWLYPWGNEFKRDYANIGSGRPTRIDVFGNDKSPFGVIGMAGNVSEWTSSVDEKTGKIRVRGANYVPLSQFVGMKGSTADFARVTRWLRAAPEKGYAYIGFRCVKDISQ